MFLGLGFAVEGVAPVVAGGVAPVVAGGVAPVVAGTEPVVVRTAPVVDGGVAPVVICTAELPFPAALVVLELGLAGVAGSVVKGVGSGGNGVDKTDAII